MNGSSLTGNCSRADISRTVSDTVVTTCLQPNSSVLFDGHVPTLTGLDGDMWASQLLVLRRPGVSTSITFDFTDTPGYDRVERVEVVMFNCPQWGIGTTTIRLAGATARGQPSRTLSEIRMCPITSCDSLVRVCISAPVHLPVVILHFLDWDSNDWLHLAEVTFYARGPTCPRNVILNPPPVTAGT